MRLAGGCFCGALRYEIEAEGAVVDYCHCRTCRKITGGATVAWAQVAPSAFRFTAGEPRAFDSSPVGRRLFCPTCGAHVAMTDPAGRSIGITVGTLDDPEAVEPIAHGFESERPGWLCLADDMPRYLGIPPHDAD